MDNEEIRELLNSIIKADKTGEYGYGSTRADRNKNGERPPVGSRWMTPAEICKEALEEIKEEEEEEVIT